MTVVGFITEYNPFHFGHKYHLQEAVKTTNADYSIAIMSGSFLQRGEPSFIDKWTKAKMAVDNGVDLVLELPFIFSSQSAELFAYGGVKLMDALNIVDYIAFGSELGEVEPLNHIAQTLAFEPEYYKERLKHHLSLGLSYSVSRSNALVDYNKSLHTNVDYDYKEILNKSNNILGIEYLKALIKIQSNIKPIAIKRSGSNYKDTEISSGFASATALRQLVKNNDLSHIKSLVPDETYISLLDYLKEYNSFNYIENYNMILLYMLRSLNNKQIKNLLDAEPGLDNRFIEYGNKSNNITDIIDSIVTKRYPRTRIQRLFMHLLNNLDKETFKELYEIYPSYIRVLAASKNGLHLLNQIKKTSTLPIITKFADYKHFKNPNIDRIITYDKQATDLFFLGLHHKLPLTNMDYYKSPYIK